MGSLGAMKELFDTRTEGPTGQAAG
jgi:hypothetical protein